MIVKVITEDDREYYSVVFAMFYKGWDSVAITYDDKNACFHNTNLYQKKPSLKRKAFILECDESKWKSYEMIKLGINNTIKNVKGYAWLLENTDLLKRIINNKSVDEQYLTLAAEYNARLDLSEWKYVKNKADAENLMSAAFGFHDAVIYNISFAYENYLPSKLEIRFGECWESSVTLIFEGDIVSHYVHEERVMPDIYDASVFFEDGYVYWTDCEASSFSEISEESTYFRGRALKWKMETENES